MGESLTANQQIFNEINRDLMKTKQWALTFILSGLGLQLLHFMIELNNTFTSMLIITGVILFGAGVIFFLGTKSVPNTPEAVLKRLQYIMLNRDPKRRLWAAQRFVGYLKDANIPKEMLLSVCRDIASVVIKPPVGAPYQHYVAVDHIVVLREMAVNIPMNKHVRKDFVKILKPLRKLEGFPEEAYSLLMDAIGYHPQKLPVQAYSDLMKEDEKVE